MICIRCEILDRICILFEAGTDPINSDKVIVLFERHFRAPCKVRGHCMCKKMLVIPVNGVVDPKRIIGKNGGPRRKRGTSHCPPHTQH
jgi:hypothetical protein